ncbi:uncharacterized protein EKO05_0005934 [Ascochyta rabiei]|uniref:uncharacterized protein n=1 Tax=Didymella rabiei TaxID=5454 RepID=UPI0021FDB187|nr:uncharacterized protein EKO05_0005934 [Ascochyta rabiei]UPX15488.1 hypothetical protein EKO05_0005934 [Ascochyta rabiei]
MIAALIDCQHKVPDTVTAAQILYRLLYKSQLQCLAPCYDLQEGRIPIPRYDRDGTSSRSPSSHFSLPPPIRIIPQTDAFQALRLTLGPPIRHFNLTAMCIDARVKSNTCGCSSAAAPDFLRPFLSLNWLHARRSCFKT